MASSFNRGGMIFKHEFLKTHSSVLSNRHLTPPFWENFPVFLQNSIVKSHPEGHLCVVLKKMRNCAHKNKKR